MRRDYFSWTIGFLLLIAQFAIGADLNCYISNNTCDEATLLYMKNDSNGYNNAHAQLVNATNLYDYRLCCNSTLQSINESCGTAYLRLSNITNAHVQDASQSFTVNYNYSACISGNGTILCDVISGTCPAPYECLLSIASGESNNYTNAHIAECGYYQLSVCCYANTPPVHTTPILNATDHPLNRTTANLTCYNQSTYDADGDIVINVYTFDVLNKGYTILNVPFEANNSCGSNCTRDYASNINFTWDTKSQSMPTWKESSIVNNSMLFNGSQSLTSSSEITITPAQNFSIECWILTNSTKNITCASLININLLSKWDGFVFGLSEGKVSYAQWKNGLGYEYQQVNGTSILSDNEPHHIVVVNDNNISIYVDGELENTENDTKSISVTNYFKIGARIKDSLQNLADYFDGTIDQVMLFNTSLTPNQIEAHYLKLYNQINYKETYKGEEWVCYVTPTDSMDDGETLSSNTLLITNTPPAVENVSVTPADPRTNDTLTCNNGTVNDADNDFVTLLYDWYNGTAWLNLNNKTLGQSYTLYGQYWNCSITPYDGESNGTTVVSDKVFINNTIPSTPILLTPTNGNETLFWRNVTFTWNASYDPDVNEGTQSLVYELNITSPTCPDHFHTNIPTTNYTLNYDLECVGHTYFWRVRSYDGVDYSNWSDEFNFTIEPTVIINLTNDFINFGSKIPGDIDDTDDNNPEPMIVENQGNVNFDTTIFAQDSLWTAVGVNTSYFQVKARNTSEENSFDNTSQRSAMTFTNVTGFDENASTYIIGNLSYVDTRDTAYADFYIKVPISEPPGAKSSDLVFTGEPIVE